MKTFEKIYIAKGKQVKDMSIVRISIKVEDILSHAHDYKGEQFLTFEVAKLKNPDNFGNDHTVYVNKLVEDGKPDEKTQTKPADKKGKKTPKPQAKNDEIPF